MSDGDGKGGALVYEAYFPTLIAYSDLADGAAINAETIPAIRDWRREDEAGIVRSNVAASGSWHSAVNMHQRPEFARLTAAVRATAERYAADQGFDPAFELATDNMWANINPPGGYNRAHIHPHSTISGVYYLQAPEGAGRIIFYEPRTHVAMSSPRFIPDKQRDARYWTEVNYQPIEGRIILFPSWLLHEVQPNEAQGTGEAADRISVSFNLFQRRRRA